MSFLQQIKKTETSAGNASATQEIDVVGVVLTLKTAQVIDGKFKLTGIVNNNNRQVKAGQEVQIEFRDKLMDSCLSNFTKGHGTKKSLEQPNSAADSLMSLEGCYFTGEIENGLPVFNARWLTTVASSIKKHNDRILISDVFATAPVITFTNPSKQDGEPERIRLPVNAEGDIYHTVKNPNGGSASRKFSTEWTIDKLRAATDPVVNIETISSLRSDLATTKEQLHANLTEQLSAGSTSMAMLRLTDGTEVMTRKVYVSFKKEGDKFIPDIDATLNNLFSRNLFKDVDDNDLFDGLVSGKATLESVPGYRFRYSGNATQDDNISFKIVQNVLDNKRQGYQAIYGNDPNNMVKTILTGILRTPKDGSDPTLQDFSPNNQIRDENGIFNAKTFPSKHINNAAQSVDAEPEPEPEPEPIEPEPITPDPVPTPSVVEPAAVEVVGPEEPEDEPVRNSLTL